MINKGSSLTPAQALDKLDALYEQSVKALRSAIGKYIETGILPDVTARHNGLLFTRRFVSPDGSATNPLKTRAYGRFTHAAATPRRLPVHRFFVRILRNSSRCCIRIMMRISPSSHRCMKFPIHTSLTVLN